MTAPAQTLDDILPGCKLYDEAVAVSLALIEQRKVDRPSNNEIFFLTEAEKALPPVLHAAASMDEDASQVIKWLSGIGDERVHAEVDAVLRWTPTKDVRAIEAWSAFCNIPAAVRADVADLVIEIVKQGSPAAITEAAEREAAEERGRLIAARQAAIEQADRDQIEMQKATASAQGCSPTSIALGDD